MKKQEITRYKFEKLIIGDWLSIRGDRQRRNGKFTTYVRKPWKFVSDGSVALRAKTWKELAVALKLVGDGKAIEKDVSNEE